MEIKKVLFVHCFALISSTAFAQSLVMNEQNLRTDLNWLAQQGVIQISTSTWPLSSEEIDRALSNAHVHNQVQQNVLDSVKHDLNLANESLKISLYAATDKKELPQSFGDNNKAQYVGSAQASANGEQWSARLKVNAEGDKTIKENNHVNFDGSYLAGKIWNQWVALGQIPAYWGPGHEGSLIRGDAIRSVPGITVQRAEQNPFESKWLSWIGTWQYQYFWGRMNDYTAVPGAQLMGLRMSMQPTSYLELGGTRTMEIGGKGQPNGLNAYWNAVIGNDNACNAANPNCIGDENASNQLAGLDARLNLQPLLHFPVSVYGQWVGEDVSNMLPSKHLYLAGLDYSSMIKNMPIQLYAEWADTRTNFQVRGITYTHHQFTDGYYQQGFPIGFPIGGDGQMYSIGGDIQLEPTDRLSGRAFYTRVNPLDENVNDAFPQSDTIKALDMTWTHYVNPQIPLKLNGWVSSSDHLHKDIGASLEVEFPLELKALKF